jgi:hypothetical protein
VTRSNLQGFYIEGGSLMDRAVPSDASAEIVAQYTQDADAWLNKTNNWIAAELGMAASARFLDRTAYPSRSMVGANPAVGNVKIAIADFRQNLAKMIETKLGMPAHRNSS